MVTGNTYTRERERERERGGVGGVYIYTQRFECIQNTLNSSCTIAYGSADKWNGMTYGTRLKLNCLPDGF